MYCHQGACVFVKSWRHAALEKRIFLSSFLVAQMNVLKHARLPLQAVAMYAVFCIGAFVVVKEWPGKD